MKNLNKICFLILIAAFSFLAFAAVDAPSFLRTEKHYKKVVKRTSKLERALLNHKPEEEEAPPVEETTPFVISSPSPIEEQDVVTATPEEQPKVVNVEPEDKTGFLSSVAIKGNIYSIKLKDEYGRTARLISSPVYGAYVQLGYRFNENLAIVGSYYVEKVKFDNFDAISVTQSGSYLMGGKLGVRFYATEGFNIELLGALEQHYTAYSLSRTAMNLERFNHGTIDLGLNYKIIEKEHFLMDGRTDFNAYLPTTRAKWKTQLGFGATTELDFGVRLTPNSSLYLAAGGGYYNLRQSIDSQYGLLGYMGFGFALNK